MESHPRLHAALERSSFHTNPVLVFEGHLRWSPDHSCPCPSFPSSGQISGPIQEVASLSALAPGQTQILEATAQGAGEEPTLRGTLSIYRETRANSVVSHSFHSNLVVSAEK